MKIDQSGSWRLYQPYEMQGYKMLGVVTDDRGQTGALAVTKAGIYVRLNAGTIASLPQADVESAIWWANAEFCSPDECDRYNAVRNY
jgi:hypothetical protein